MAYEIIHTEPLVEQLERALKKVIEEEIERYVGAAKERITEAIIERVKVLQTNVKGGVNSFRSTMDIEIALRTEPTADKLKEQIIAVMEEWAVKQKRKGGTLEA